MEEEIKNAEEYRKLKSLQYLIEEQLDAKLVMHVLLNQPLEIKLNVSMNSFIPHSITIRDNNNDYIKIESYFMEKWQVSFGRRLNGLWLDDVRLSSKRYTSNFAMTYHYVKDDDKMLEIIDKYFILK